MVKVKSAVWRCETKTMFFSQCNIEKINICITHYLVKVDEVDCLASDFQEFRTLEI